MTRSEVFQIPVDVLEPGRAEWMVRQHLRNGARPFTIYSLNAYKVHLIKSGLLPLDVFKRASMILPDGISVVYALRMAGHKIKNVVAGVDFMISLLEIANEMGLSVFFLGSPQHLLDRVVRKCKNEYSNVKIAGFQHGFYPLSEEEAVVSKIARSRADIVFVAFGSPRKELFVDRHITAMNTRIAIGVGGSYEVFVGDKKRGAAWMQRLGLEWVNRLLQDPKRLGPRYFVSNLSFLRYLVLDLITKDKNYGAR